MQLEIQQIAPIIGRGRTSQPIEDSCPSDPSPYAAQETVVDGKLHWHTGVKQVDGLLSLWWSFVKQQVRRHLAKLSLPRRLPLHSDCATSLDISY